MRILVKWCKVVGDILNPFLFCFLNCELSITIVLEMSKT